MTAHAHCDAFERWLDAGLPAAGAAEARAHAAACPRCAPALEAALEVERFLAEETAHAPAGFTARVMERVAAAGRAGALDFTPAPLAWWLRAGAEPATALALALAALLTWQHERLPALFAAGLLRLAGWITQGLAQLPSLTRPLTPLVLPYASAWVSQPVFVWGLALALLPGVLWTSGVLYRWSAHAAALPARRL
jgi:hypothetical protein